MTREKIIVILLLLLSAGGIRADQASIPALTSLDPVTNVTVKTIRGDVRRVIYVIKSGRPENDLPRLQFYQYRVKKGDSFWNIMTKLSLDIDTLMTVNDLSSPRDLSPGRILFIPNMRGILLKVNGKTPVAAMLGDSGINPRYVTKINNSDDFNRQYLFIPCGKVTNLQRSLFMGIGFVNPEVVGVGHVLRRIRSDRSLHDRVYDSANPQMCTDDENNAQQEQVNCAEAGSRRGQHVMTWSHFNLRQATAPPSSRSR